MSDDPGHDMAGRTQLPRWQVVAVSLRGTRHEKTGQPCQDVHRWQTLPDGILVAVIADGAGSATLGEVGADIAARAAIERVCASITAPPLPGDDASWQDLLTDALQVAQATVEDEATTRGVGLRELATTLILAIATPDLVAVAQVGDGAAIVADETMEPVALTVPAHGEYVNETTFLVSPCALDSAQVRVWHGTAMSLAVLSDGLQRMALKLPSGEPHAPFFSPLFEFAAAIDDPAEAERELLTFLGSPRVVERTDDDVTLLLAAYLPSL